ncbi:MAG: hypothetical protein HS113_01885 [Verrucomicrobiales bacterium]|nr:hypothetical protein [Verrucomicrobiales bacterium]
MKPGIKSHLAECAIAAVLVLVGLVGIERIAQSHMDRLRAEMDAPARWFTGTLSEIQADALDRRLALFEGRSLPAPVGGIRWQTHVAQWAAGEKQATPGTSPVVPETLAVRFHDVLTNYLETITSASSAGVPDPLLTEVITLCDQLRQLTAAAEPEQHPVPGATLDSLQRVWFLSLLLVAVATGVGVAVFYRRLIAPLRVELGKSRVHLERHEKLASLGVLATGIAHEIRNPLTAIKVRLFSLKRGAPEMASVQEDVHVISQEINRLERIVGDFLQFARPPELARQNLPVRSLVQQVERLLGPPLAGRSVSLVLEPPPEAWVLADPEKLKQVLINLVQNAAQSIAHEGQVTLRVDLAHQELLGHPTDVVRIEVIDTGAGMPPEVVRRLFDPFFTTKDDGTGLGLPIAARIVELHDGVIEYETQPQRGTTFTVVLPRVTPDEAPTPNPVD